MDDTLGTTELTMDASVLSSGLAEGDAGVAGDDMNVCVGGDHPMCIGTCWGIGAASILGRLAGGITKAPNGAIGSKPSIAALPLPFAFAGGGTMLGAEGVGSARGGPCNDCNSISPNASTPFRVPSDIVPKDII